ncbi:hypothetical protein [Sphingomicrobium nitratireducens]|uniref:hypothetical protein n=1 Tax=Sphingomicrobium nitratireducens TaxID=2964666 RepID=UPI00223FE3FB|nr:hypothetical protein [Sphingomicrobium nitratireducens]
MRKILAMCSLAAMVATSGAYAQGITGKEGRQARQKVMDQRGIRDYGELKGKNVTYDPSKDTPDTLGAYDMALHNSACIDRTLGDTVKEALDTQPATRKEEFKFDRLFSKGKGCGGPTTVVLTLQRGMLSEAAYLNDYPEQVPLPMHVDSGAVKAFRDSQREWNDERSPADKMLIDAANCLVISNPAVADLLARTQHGTGDEEKVMDALFNAAPDCAGARPTVVSKTYLRAFIMDALYRASNSEIGKPVFMLGG